MPWWIYPLMGAWQTICGVWLMLLIAQFAARRRGLLLDAANAPALPATPPSLAIVIPARNEADNIEGCLCSVLAQDYPGFRVIVVDDRSEDETASIVRRITAADPRVTLVSNHALPEGWMGKTHALHIGGRTASEDWMLFVDADCRLDPPAARVAVATALHQDAGLLSLWPRQAEGGFWEHLLIPLCAGIIALWYGSADQSPTSRRRPFANGQFLLLSREAYRIIGGHESVREALIEDVIIAERARAKGVRSWVGSGAQLFAVRMYTSLEAILRGWSRIYVGALRSRVRLVLSILWLVFGSLPPYIVLPALALSPRTPANATLWNTALILGIAHLVVMMMVSYRFWGLGRCKRSLLWIYPLAVFMVCGILAHAIWCVMRKAPINWRGTIYVTGADARISSSR